MNFDPRLPDIPAGDDKAPVTLGWLRQFRERFYQWNRELSDAVEPADQKIGTWTPVLTFATPGDLAVTYTATTGQLGFYTRFGRMVKADFQITTTAFTHTTAAGALQVTGLPYSLDSITPYENAHAVEYSGMTKAGYHSVFSRLSSASTVINFDACGSAVAAAVVTFADMPTGGNIVLRGSILYRTT